VTDLVPVITIDGPSGSGKGAVSARVAEALGWNVLDSGSLYRLTGLAVEKAGIGFEDLKEAARIAENLDVRFEQWMVFLDGEDVTLAIRSETAGNNASKVAAVPEVRAALLDWQRRAARLPGLVADGRDMGTTVFPDALLKVFLDASVEERARRRYKQLKEKGISSNIDRLAVEIRERDGRDRSRTVSPLFPASGALIIDSTGMTIEAVVERILQAARELLPSVD